MKSSPHNALKKKNNKNGMSDDKTNMKIIKNNEAGNKTQKRNKKENKEIDNK